jgi:hypothetical protein
LDGSTTHGNTSSASSYTVLADCDELFLVERRQ